MFRTCPRKASLKAKGSNLKNWCKITETRSAAEVIVSCSMFTCSFITSANSGFKWAWGPPFFGAIKKTFSSGTMGLLNTELIAKEMPAFHKSLYNRYNFLMNGITMSFNAFIHLNHSLKVLMTVMKQEKKFWKIWFHKVKNNFAFSFILRGYCSIWASSKYITAKIY